MILKEPTLFMSWYILFRIYYSLPFSAFFFSARISGLTSPGTLRSHGYKSEMTFVRFSLRFKKRGTHKFEI